MKIKNLKVYILSFIFISLCLAIFFICFYALKGGNQNIVLGPIIGKVTENSARILVEFAKEGEVTMKLFKTLDFEKEPFASFSLKVYPSNPCVFKFSNLEKATKYYITFNLNFENNLNASFKTLTGDPNGFNFAAVSCNDIKVSMSAPVEKNLWTDLYNRVGRGEIDYLIYFGDVVYLDSSAATNVNDTVFNKALRNYNTTFQSHKEEIREMIRDKYRMTFNYTPTAQVLSKIPSLMVMDDHEIRNNFNLNYFEEYVSNPFKKFWAIQARYVYFQYCRQLREDVALDSDITVFNTSPEYFVEILNNIGFLFSDFRTTQIFYLKKSDEYSYFGETQIKFIQDSLSETGLFNKTELIYVVSTAPLYTYNKPLLDLSTVVFNSVGDEIKSFITYNNTNELKTISDQLISWKRKDREIFLIGGDIHLALHTDIYFQGNLAFKGLVSSGISVDYSQDNQKLYFILSQIMELFQSIDNIDYCFQHKSIFPSFNYAIINTNKIVGKSPEVKSFHVISNGENFYAQKQYSTTDLSVNSNCCGKNCKINYIEVILSKFGVKSLSELENILK